MGFFYGDSRAMLSRAPVIKAGAKAEEWNGVTLHHRFCLRCWAHKNRFSGSTKTEFASAKYRIKMDYKPPISDSWHAHPSNRPRVSNWLPQSHQNQRKLDIKGPDIWIFMIYMKGTNYMILYVLLIICVFLPPKEHIYNWGV